MDDNTTCNRSKRKRRSISSLQSSSIEDIDKIDKANKKDQMSASSVKTSAPPKPPESASEANSNGNNQDIKSQTKIINPSNTSQTSQSEFQASAFTIQHPYLSDLTYTPNCCMKCLKLLQASLNNAPTTSSFLTSKGKCTRKTDDALFSSSSSSTMSQHFPVKQKKRQNPMPKQKYATPLSKTLVLKCLIQPTTEQWESLNDVPSNERYFSCSSDESENEEHLELNKLKNLYKDSNVDKNRLILQLLQEIVYLINKEGPKASGSLNIAQVVSSNTEDKTSKIVVTQSETQPESQPKPPKEPLIIPARQHTINVPPHITLPQPPINIPNCCPCICYAQGMAAAQVHPPMVPYIHPYNIKMYDADEPSLPELIASQDSKDVFLDCNSSSSIKSTPSCKCPNLSIICPVHGPLKQFLKNADIVCCVTSKPGDICLPKTTELFICKCTIQEEENKVCSEDKVKDEYIDEELEPRSTLREFAEPLQTYQPPADCLSAYDDEEPDRPDYVPYVIKCEETEEYVDEELESRFVPKMFGEPSEMYQPPVDSISRYDDYAPKGAEKVKEEEKELEELKPNDEEITSFGKYETRQAAITEKLIPLNKTVQEHTANADETVKEIDAYAEETGMDVIAKNLPPRTAAEVPDSTEEQPNFVRTSTVSGHHIYNFMPEIDQNIVDDQRQIISYNKSEEEEYESYYPEYECEFIDDEYELAKEKRAESRKKKKRDKDDDASTDMTLATVKRFADEGSKEEMKFFIDSLIVDLEAMEFSRRKSQFDKKICKPKSICGRESFPVTITEITDLGANSLYVKWIVHDCCGIGGYEIYTDGYLTNRFYNSKHEAAVITNVDVTLPHQITLMAKPSAAEGSLELLCNMANNKTKTKSLPWATNMENDRNALFNCWTPSVYLYNPCSSCPANV